MGKKDFLPTEKRTVLQALHGMQGCNCTITQYMAGDGCGVCNPAKALEYARETMADLQAHRDMLAAALRRLIDCYSVSHSPKMRADCWAQAQKALDFDA